MRARTAYVAPTYDLWRLAEPDEYVLRNDLLDRRRDEEEIAWLRDLRARYCEHQERGE